MKKAVAITAYICIIILFVWGGWWLGRATATAEPPFYLVTDTIIDWRHDTVYLHDTRVVKLPVHDTTRCVDSVMVVDSVEVEVPIYRYMYDTLIAGERAETRLRAVVTGYDVRVDTLVASTVVRPVAVEIPWHKRIRPSVGVGVGTTMGGEAAVGVFVGVGWLF